MKKNTYLSIIFCLTILGLMSPMFSIKTAQAVSLDDLIVIFNTKPLFGAVNFAPGQSVSGLVEVKNNSGATKTIITEAINVTDPQKFGDGLGFKIKENDNTVYGNGEKTLTNFFNAGEVNLSSLSNGVTTTYEYIVTFQPAANDDYQGKKLDNFDILIGFKGEEGRATVISGTGGGGGGTGGTGALPAGLTIYTEASSIASNNEVIITWLTNYYSTSRVIYSVASEEHIFNLSSIPDYGYAHSSPEINTPANPNGVTFHSVTLNSLLPGTTYYYRVISHASPDTVGKELSFTTSGNLATEQNQTGKGQNVSQPSQGGTVFGEQTGGTAGSEEEIISSGDLAGEASAAPGATGIVAGETSDKIAEQVQGASDQVPVVLPVCLLCNVWFWLILVLLFMVLALGYWLITS